MKKTIKKPKTVFHYISLFPEMFEAYLKQSILKRGKEDNFLDFKFYNPRDFSKDKNRRIDRRPYGGGPGMVIEALPVIRAVKQALTRAKSKKIKIIWTSPRGKLFTNKTAETLAKKYKDFVFIAGRYEGIDERAKKILKAESYSIGDYVLTGGELPAMVMSDAISRRIEGVLGDPESLEESRISSGAVYTRPEVFVWKGKTSKVPKVLMRGDHKKIEIWRKEH